MTTDNVMDIGVRFKSEPDDDQIFEVVRDRECHHQYRIDIESDTVYCAKCPKTFNPMAVLLEFARQEERWRLARESYQDEMTRLRKRKKTKCDHCGRMTSISKR